MKRFWPACLLLAGILTGCLVSARYALRLTEEIVFPLQRAQSMVQSEQWSQAHRLSRQAYKKWERSEFYCCILISHGQPDQISSTFRRLFFQLDRQNQNGFLETSQELIQDLNLLGQTEQPTLYNIL